MPSPTDQAPSHGVARAINAEAGDHAVTGDPVERAAAERAIRRSYAQFPYYGLRYGARGRRFSASDSAWLVTLCDLSPAQASEQALWLGTVLSSRGMPRWLLECHLAQLHEELVRARPADAARYAALDACAAALRERRRRVLSDDDLAALDRAFDARAPEAEARRLPHTGGMLAAATADERDGVDAAVPSLAHWLVDAERFSAEWIVAVHETLAEARERT
jgi:hypothetical protein